MRPQAPTSRVTAACRPSAAPTWTWRCNGRPKPTNCESARFTPGFRASSRSTHRGDQVDESGAVVAVGTPDSVPLYRFNAVRARLYGIEIEGRKRLAELPWQLDGTSQFDMTRGTQPEHRRTLAAHRAVAAQARARCGARPVDGTHRGRPCGAPEPRARHRSGATSSYTLVNLSLSQRFSMNLADAIWFVKLTNLGNERAYSASTIETIRGLSPLPGRAVQVGMRVTF